MAVVARAEHGEHRHDAAEDAEEELGDLKDRIPAEVVGFAGGLRGEQQGSAGDHDEERVAEHALEREVHAEEREVHARAPEAGHQDRADDGGEKQDVDAAVDADGLLFLGRLEAILDVAGEHEAVDREVDRKQDGAGHEPRKHQVLKRPEEAHALEEAEEERRIAERGQRAPHVGDEENEEDEGVDLAPAVLVGADERADEKHGSARRTHEVGKHGAEREDRGVHDRTTDEAAADVNAAGQDAGVDHGGAHQRALQAHAAGHGEQGEQQHDEGDVLQQDGMEEFIEGHVEAVDHQTGNQEGKAPEDGDLAEMMVPDVRGEQREKRDGKQNAGKRHGPRKAELGAVHVARHGGSRQQKGCSCSRNAFNGQSHDGDSLGRPPERRPPVENGVRWKVRSKALPGSGGANCTFQCAPRYKISQNANIHGFSDPCRTFRGFFTNEGSLKPKGLENERRRP